MSECCVCFNIIKTKYKHCKDCRDRICTDCVKGDYTLSDWLENISNRCSKCDKLLCSNCVRLCFSCANYSGDVPIYCTACAKKEKVKDIKCPHHRWYSCPKKHEDEGCGECRANKNYDRYGLFT